MTREMRAIKTISGIKPPTIKELRQEFKRHGIEGVLNSTITAAPDEYAQFLCKNLGHGGKIDTILTDEQFAEMAIQIATRSTLVPKGPWHHATNIIVPEGMQVTRYTDPEQKGKAAIYQQDHGYSFDMKSGFATKGDNLTPDKTPASPAIISAMINMGWKFTESNFSKDLTANSIVRDDAEDLIENARTTEKKEEQARLYIRTNQDLFHP